MPTTRPRTRPPFHLQRGCERSRLEAQLVAAAYELALPVSRQVVSGRQHLRTEKTFPQLSPARRQGVCA